MASIMALSDDCLCTILSFISDGDTFYNFAVSCRRFANVAKSINYIRSEILKVKADFYMKRVLLDRKECSSEVIQKMKNLLTDSVNLVKQKCLVSERKLLDVWEKNGPVAAKLFSWMTSRTEREETGEPHATCSTNFTELKLCLPSVKQCMTVSTRYFHDYSRLYGHEMSIELSCGDVKVLTNEFPRINPYRYNHYDPQDLTKGLQPLQPARDLLSKEIGINLPDNFFFWFCFFFPLGQNLSEEDKVFFDNAAKNNKPSREQLQNVVAGFRKNLKKKLINFERAHKIVVKTDTTILESLKALVNTLRSLIKRKETRMIQKLEKDYLRIIRFIIFDDLKKIPRELLLSLLLRTNLDWSNFSPCFIATKDVSSSAKFRLTKRRILKVEGIVVGNRVSWLGVNVKFLLPDNTELKFEAAYSRWDPHKSRFLKVDQLRPVTMLLQECINHDFENQDEIPEISDAFTAVYFLGVLDLSYFTQDFLNIGQRHILVKRGKVSSAFGVSDDDDAADHDGEYGCVDDDGDDGSVDVNDDDVGRDSDVKEIDDAGESDGIDGDDDKDSDIHNDGDDDSSD